MKKVIITGATGFIGTHLVRRLIAENIEVYAICNKDSKNMLRIKHLHGVKIIEGEISDYKFICEHVQSKTVDVFYHLAWENSSGSMRMNVQSQSNNIAYLNGVAEVARELGCKKIIATGTISEKLCESIDKINTFYPASYYLFCKKISHSILKQLTQKFNIDLVWCTFCHPIGEYNKLDQLIAHTIEDMINNKSLVFREGNNLFDVIAVEDLSNALYLAGKNDLTKKEYFIGSGLPQELRFYIERVKQLINPCIDILFGALPDDGLQLKEEWLDSSPFCSETGFAPQVDFDEAVRRTAKWVQSVILASSSNTQKYK